MQANHICLNIRFYTSPVRKQNFCLDRRSPKFKATLGATDPTFTFIIGKWKENRQSSKHTVNSIEKYDSFKPLPSSFDLKKPWKFYTTHLWQYPRFYHYMYSLKTESPLDYFRKQVTIWKDPRNRFRNLFTSLQIDFWKGMIFVNSRRPSNKEYVGKPSERLALTVMFAGVSKYWMDTGFVEISGRFGTQTAASIRCQIRVLCTNISV